MESAPTHRDGACIDSESSCCRGRTMPAPTIPSKNSRPLRHRTWAGGCYSDFIASAHTPAVHRQRGPQWADRRSAGLGHRAARRTWRPCRCRPRRGQPSGRQRPCGSGSAPAPSCSRRPLRWACGAVPSPSPSRYRPRQTG